MDVGKTEVTRTLSGYSNEINSIAFTPGGQWFASGSDDGSTRIWDSRTGDAMATLISLRESAGGLSVRQTDWLVASPDGFLMARQTRGTRYCGVLSNPPSMFDQSKRSSMNTISGLTSRDSRRQTTKGAAGYFARDRRQPRLPSPLPTPRARLMARLVRVNWPSSLRLLKLLRIKNTRREAEPRM